MSNATRPNSPVALQLPNMTIHGYTGTLILTGDSGAEIVATLRAMQEAGMTQSAAPATSTAAAGSAPMCPVHNRPMKPSRKPGSFYCSAKVGEGYCDQHSKG